jgi:hypothetical protein
MSQLRVDECLRILELPRSADGTQMQSAFRRLAKVYHPDLNLGPDARARFIAVVEAYRFLQDEFGLAAGQTRLPLCPRCGRRSELLDGLDGRSGCPSCLLGESSRTHLLPLPVVEIVRHLAVFALYLGAVLCMLRYLETHALHDALVGLSLVLAGMLVLAWTCLRVRDVQ